MIFGLGIDVVSLARIEKTLVQFGDRFLARCFHPLEQAHALRNTKTKHRTLAKRFAAKEACAKAFGVGIGRHIGWRDLYVVNLTSGQPAISLSPKAQVFLETLTPTGFSPKIHISLADDEFNAHATVIISLWPIERPV